MVGSGIAGQPGAQGTGAGGGVVAGTLVGAIAGVGLDAVAVERLRALLARRPAVADRLFHPAELAYVARQHDPVPSLAVRFAAKEAAMKALGVGLGAFGFQEVWVERVAPGPPALHLAGRAAELAAHRRVAQWHLSLSHTAELALALVVAERGVQEVSG